jgi:hypothetical protein
MRRNFSTHGLRPSAAIQLALPAYHLTARDNSSMDTEPQSLILQEMCSADCRVQVTVIDAHGIGNGGSGAAAGLLHPCTPKGQIAWLGRESFEAACRLIATAEAAVPEATQASGAAKRRGNLSSGGSCRGSDQTPARQALDTSSKGHPSCDEKKERKNFVDAPDKHGAQTPAGDHHTAHSRAIDKSASTEHPNAEQSDAVECNSPCTRAAPKPVAAGEITSTGSRSVDQARNANAGASVPDAQQPIAYHHGILRIGAHAQQAWELSTNLERALTGGHNVAGGVPVTACDAKRLVPGLTEQHLAAALLWKAPRPRERAYVAALRDRGAPR